VYDDPPVIVSVVLVPATTLPLMLPPPEKFKDPLFPTPTLPLMTVFPELMVIWTPPEGESPSAA
jgi:hypothetical protein